MSWNTIFPRQGITAGRTYVLKKKCSDWLDRHARTCDNRCSRQDETAQHRGPRAKSVVAKVTCRLFTNEVVFSATTWYNEYIPNERKYNLLSNSWQHIGGHTSHRIMFCIPAILERPARFPRKPLLVRPFPPARATSVGLESHCNHSPLLQRR